jgi:hypothetical protein
MVKGANMTNHFSEGVEAMLAKADECLVLPERNRPPIERWHPLTRVQLDMRIAADGTWYYHGKLIERHPLIKLFVSILRQEEDGYYLVTPQEKAKIQVDDAPLVIVDAELQADPSTGRLNSVCLLTNTDESYYITPETPLTGCRERQSSVAPHLNGLVAVQSAVDKGTVTENAWYLHLDRGLSARVARPVYYRLANYVSENEQGEYGFFIKGCWYRLD